MPEKKVNFVSRHASKNEFLELKQEVELGYAKVRAGLISNEIYIRKLLDYFESNIDFFCLVTQDGAKVSELLANDPALDSNLFTYLCRNYLASAYIFLSTADKTEFPVSVLNSKDIHGKTPLQLVLENPNLLAYILIIKLQEILFKKGIRLNGTEIKLAVERKQKLDRLEQCPREAILACMYIENHNDFLGQKKDYIELLSAVNLLSLQSTLSVAHERAAHALLKLNFS